MAADGKHCSTLVSSQLPQQWVFIPFHWVFEAEEERKERKEWERGEIVGNQAHLLCFVKSTVYWFTGCGCVKLLRCYLHNPLIAFRNSKEMDLLGIRYIVFQYIYIIYSAVFVTKNAKGSQEIILKYKVCQDPRRWLPPCAWKIKFDYNISIYEL
jgi:hypothetical protein